MTSKKAETILKDRGLKITSTRLILLGLFIENNSAISQNYIQGELNKTDRVTVYRTLKTFEELGIIHEAMNDKNGSFFAMCSSGCSSHSHTHNHSHFRCTGCETVSCNDEIKTPEIVLPGKVVQKVELIIEGLCENCVD